MAQARVSEPEKTPHRQMLEACKFRWCRKHQRWEKNFRSQEHKDYWLKNNVHFRLEVNVD